MKINVEIDEEIKAIEVLIRNHEWNEEVKETPLPVVTLSLIHFLILYHYHFIID
ncbi:hypothetical protein V3595_00330 [Bacillus sp. CFBP9009]|uniref:hypothetical protein n=1 Tax=Peribacillus simplex TaxID=1478 RepID=UPI0014854DFE|nr:hypothetical protein [Peribacillus simplex]